jgi:hypothetical protein
MGLLSIHQSQHETQRLKIRDNGEVAKEDRGTSWSAHSGAMTTRLRARITGLKQWG